MEGLVGVFVVMVYEYKVEKVFFFFNFDSISVGLFNKQGMVGLFNFIVFDILIFNIWLIL